MHPVLFSLGPFTLRSYGLAMALSFALGLWMALRLNRRAGRPDEPLLDLVTWIILGSIAGARALYVIVQWPQFSADLLSIFKVWQGGLVFYGGLIGGALSAYIWLRRHHQPVWAYGDVLAPALALGQVTGRLGCWFNGCCYGREDAVHGVVFPSLGDSIPHLPVMLYESGFCLLLAGALYRLWSRRRFDGQVFWSYVLAYSAWRFGIEILRGDTERGWLLSTALSPSQWISLVGLALGLVQFWRLRRLGARA